MAILGEDRSGGGDLLMMNAEFLRVAGALGLHAARMPTVSSADQGQVDRPIRYLSGPGRALPMLTLSASGQYRQPLWRRLVGLFSGTNSRCFESLANRMT